MKKQGLPSSHFCSIKIYLRDSVTRVLKLGVFKKKVSNWPTLIYKFLYPRPIGFFKSKALSRHFFLIKQSLPVTVISIVLWISVVKKRAPIPHNSRKYINLKGLTGESGLFSLNKYQRFLNLISFFKYQKVLFGYQWHTFEFLQLIVSAS